MMKLRGDKTRRRVFAAGVLFLFAICWFAVYALLKVRGIIPTPGTFFTQMLLHLPWLFVYILAVAWLARSERENR